jgi:hypothetical protein
LETFFTFGLVAENVAFGHTEFFITCKKSNKNGIVIKSYCMHKGKREWKGSKEKSHYSLS